MDVSININHSTSYCKKAPYSPDIIYPELRNLPFLCDTDPTNSVYKEVRKCILNLELDRKNIGTPEWNPFKDFIQEGHTVFIKPNLVLHHLSFSEDISGMVTHASVIRPIIDYTLLALNGSGKIIIGDSPQADADFSLVIKRNGLLELISFYKEQGINVELLDLRMEYYPEGFVNGIRKDLLGDPNGYILCALSDEESFFCGIDETKLYGADYDRNFTSLNHKFYHKYLISRSVLMSDVIISIPKMKTHRKAGVTLNYKNMVGINGNKNYLPHYRIGAPMNDGDEYPDDINFFAKATYWWFRFASDNLLVKNTKMSRYIFRICNLPFGFFHRLYKAIFNVDYMVGHGDWYGNDTVWRMCLDLNKIILHGDSEGKIGKDFDNMSALKNKIKFTRRYFGLVDGIIAGEGNGPLDPISKKIGYIACGTDPFLIDYICTYQMGFDPRKIPIMQNLLVYKNSLLEKMESKCIVNGVETSWTDVNMQFLPPFLWKGHIEREE